MTGQNCLIPGQNRVPPAGLSLFAWTPPAALHPNGARKSTLDPARGAPPGRTRGLWGWLGHPGGARNRRAAPIAPPWPG